VTAAPKTRYVDASNPDLAVDCPRCGLKTARFVDHCRNCSYKLWPSSVMASAAFKAWRAADPVPRSTVSRFDMEYPVEVDNTVDYTAKDRRSDLPVGSRRLGRDRRRTHVSD
jgi:hypothetical protein